MPAFNNKTHCDRVQQRARRLSRLRPWVPLCVLGATTLLLLGCGGVSSAALRSWASAPGSWPTMACRARWRISRSLSAAIS